MPSNSWNDLLHGDHFPPDGLNYKATAPKIDSAAYIALNAIVIGDVVVGAQSSLCFNVVARGGMDQNRYRSA